MSQALARDRLGVPAVLFFVLAGVAPLTVAAGVIPTAYATTGLTGIPAAFLAVAVILGVFAVGYVAMARHVTSAGAFYAFVSQGIGRAAGVAAALNALLAYTCLQVGLYGALGPAAQAEAAAHLGVHAPWWAWALLAWAVIAVLGLFRVDITGWVLGVLLTAEIAAILFETISGLTRAATREGPGLLFGLGDGLLSETAQFLFMTSLFAAALAFHNVVWLYVRARPRARTATGARPDRCQQHPQDRIAGAERVWAGCDRVLRGRRPGPDVEVVLLAGTAGGFGILLLLTLTGVAIIVFFIRHPESNENVWQRLIAPALPAIALVVIVILAVRNYATLLGVPPSDAASWVLPASYAIVAVIGLSWGLLLRARRPQLYAAIGDGPHAVTTRLADSTTGTRTSR